MSRDENAFWLRPQCESETAIKQISKKSRDTSVEIELVFVPYLIYDYCIELKRLGMSPRKIFSKVAVNGITSCSSHIALDESELVPGKPEEKIIELQFPKEELAAIARKEVFFNLTKRYFMLSEPQITCLGIKEFFYPYWYAKPDYYFDARKKYLERMRGN